MQNIGFVGLGAMGLGMAASLQRAMRADGDLSASLACTDLAVFNRTPDKAAPLTSDPQLGCRALASLTDVAAACSTVCLMLADDQACLSVVQQLCEAGLQPGALIVNHSSITPECATALEQLVAAAGGAYVAAPVWGRPDAAAAARLIVAPGGPAAAVERALPLLAAHTVNGGRMLPALDTAAKAVAYKLTGNFVLFGFAQTVYEAMTLAEKAGFGRDALLQFLQAFMPSPAIQGYARRAAQGQLDASQGFTVDLALKDVRYMRQLSESSRCPLRVADAVFASLLAASANGHGSRDCGAAFLAVQQAAGLPQPQQQAAEGGGSKAADA